MVDRDLVSAKLADLSLRVGRVRRHVPPSPEELARDVVAMDLVSFNLMLAVQACLDIASHVIADEGWPAARGLRESIERLHEWGVVDAPTADALKRAAGFRNVIAHGYASADAAAIHRAGTTGLEDLDRFARQVAAWVAQRGSG